MNNMKANSEFMSLAKVYAPVRDLVEKCTPSCWGVSIEDFRSPSPPLPLSHSLSLSPSLSLIGMPLALSGTRLASRNSRQFSWRQLISNLPRFRSDERGAEGLSDTEVIVQMRIIGVGWT